jgi:hypothetical protein
MYEELLYWKSSIIHVFIEQISMAAEKASPSPQYVL